jgi:uncharacterized protein (UPF0264 family)
MMLDRVTVLQTTCHRALPILQSRLLARLADAEFRPGGTSNATSMGATLSRTDGIRVGSFGGKRCPSKC